MKEKAGKTLRLADILEMSWSYPRLGGIIMGIGIGLFVAKALDMKWGIISNDNKMFFLLMISLLCSSMGSMLASKKRDKNKEKSNKSASCN